MTASVHAELLVTHTRYSDKCFSQDRLLSDENLRWFVVSTDAEADDIDCKGMKIRGNKEKRNDFNIKSSSTSLPPFLLYFLSFFPSLLPSVSPFYPFYLSSFLLLTLPYSPYSHFTSSHLTPCLISLHSTSLLTGNTQALSLHPPVHPIYYSNPGLANRVTQSPPHQEQEPQPTIAPHTHTHTKYLPYPQDVKTLNQVLKKINHGF